MCYIKIVVVLFFACFNKETDYTQKFIHRFITQYNRETHRRPTDTLFYIPQIMNLSDSRSFHRLSISEKRIRLFEVLTRKRLFFEYYYAYDTQNETFFVNVGRGAFDYFENKRRNVVLMPPQTSVPYHEGFIKEQKAIIKYIHESSPDYMFSIFEIDGVDYRIYWALKGGRLFALEYYAEKGTICEYNAIEYINTIAPDYVFDVGLRLLM